MTARDREREDRALDSLLAAAFRLFAGESPSEKEGADLAVNPPQLSAEDENMIASMGADFVERLLGGVTISAAAKEESESNLESEEACAAMNRGGEEDGFSEQTRKEIERLRRELLGQDEPKDNDHGSR